MSRRKKKPAPLQPSAKSLTDREKIWATIRQMKEFTLLELAVRSGCGRCKARDYIVGLVRAAYLERLNPDAKRGEEAAYRLQRDTGVEAPRVRKDGTILPASGRNRMWRVMQVLKVFTDVELADAASLPNAPIAPSEAQGYCRWLGRGGYLAAQKNGGWRMIPAKFTGSRAPQILRVKKLFDPNLGLVVYEGLEQGRDDE